VAAQHGNYSLQHLDLSGLCVGYRKYITLDLPWTCLLRLHSLALSSAAVAMTNHMQPATADTMAAQQPATLGALTALTRLQLRDCSFQECSDIPSWLATQLAALAQLQHLVLCDLCSSVVPSKSIVDGTYASPAACAGLQAALAQLTQLTHLYLSSNPHGSITLPGSVAALSGLSRLQELELHHVGYEDHRQTRGEPVRLEDLPRGLTALTLWECFLKCPSSAASDVQRPALQCLVFSGPEPAQGSQPVYALAPKLQKMFCDYLPCHCDPKGDTVKQQLVCAARLQHMQSLEFYRLAHSQSIADYAALTANSHLTELRLTGCSLPAGAASHMFKAGRQLPGLQKLKIVPPDGSRSDEVPFDGEEFLALNQSPLVLGPGDAASLVACCPALRELSLVWPDPRVSRSAGAAAADGADHAQRGWPGMG
jgi:hypothetical protein